MKVLQEISTEFPSFEVLTTVIKSLLNGRGPNHHEESINYRDFRTRRQLPRGVPLGPWLPSIRLGAARTPDNAFPKRYQTQYRADVRGSPRCYILGCRISEGLAG